MGAQRNPAQHRPAGDAADERTGYPSIRHNCIRGFRRRSCNSIRARSGNRICPAFHFWRQGSPIGLCGHGTRPRHCL